MEKKLSEYPLSELNDLEIALRESLVRNNDSVIKYADTHPNISNEFASLSNSYRTWLHRVSDAIAESKQK